MLLNQTINLINFRQPKRAENYLTALKASVHVFCGTEPMRLVAQLAQTPAEFTFLEISQSNEGEMARLLVKHVQTKLILCLPAPMASELAQKNILLHGMIDAQAGLDEYLKCLWQLSEGYFYFSDSLQIGLARKSPVFNDVSSIFQLLSSREREVLSLLAEGLTNQQIGDQLFISAETVKNHKTNIMVKLNITNNNGLLLKAGEIRHFWREKMNEK